LNLTNQVEDMSVEGMIRKSFSEVHTARAMKVSVRAAGVGVFRLDEGLSWRDTAPRLWQQH
jgi:hypothetical protein